MQSIFLFFITITLSSLWFYKIYQKVSESNNLINVDIIDNKACWVYNNNIYYADIEITR